MPRLRSLRSLTVPIAAFLLASNSALALDPDRTLAQLHHTAWTAEDGAPTQVGALAQTSDGYLWIGSARGLFRFDGVEFERFVAPDSVRLSSHNIGALQATPDGALWVGFRPFGLARIVDGRLTTFELPEDMAAAQIYEFVLDHDQTVWAGTHEGLARFDGKQWVAIGPPWNLATTRVRTLLVDAAGSLLVADANGLHRLARGASAFERNSNDVGWFAKLAQDKDGRFWASGSHPLTAITLANGRVVTVASLPANTVQLLSDRDGCLWIGMSGASELRRMRDPTRIGTPAEAEELARIDSFREADGLSAGAVHVLLEDREGNIWAGTPKGLDRFRHSHFTPVALPEGHESSTLLPADDGALWVGSAASNPLLRVSAAGIEALPVSIGVSSVYRDDAGIVWWGGLNRLLRQEHDSFQILQRSAPPPGEWIWETFRGDVDGALSVSLGDSGLYRFHAGRWQKRPPTPGLPERGPSASYNAPDGRTWLGYTENRVCVLDGTQVHAYSAADGIELGRIRVIRGRGPHYWIGGELGLALFQDGRFRTVQCQGSEAFGTVSGIVESSDGSLWLNEMHGVIHIAAEEVQRLLADPTHAVAFRSYDVLEGVGGAGQMNRTCSTAVEASDGRLWFATDGGLAWIDPSRMVLNHLPPNVVIRSIQTEAARFAGTDEPRLPSDTATLRIDYTALSLSIPERIQFRYRLHGYDADWTDAGARRSAFYTRLGPGGYRFEVLAANNDGVWNTVGASAVFSIAPAFYQTRWFAAVCLLVAVGTLWLVYALRVRSVASRLQRLHDERVDERMRIAHELHDTLLQGFLSASMQLHVAHDAIPAESPAKPKLSRVLGLMDEVIADARNAVRGLRTSAEAPELEHALVRMRQEFDAGETVDFGVTVNGRARPLQAEVRDEVYRIGRESLSNAFRHAGARRIQVEVYYLPGELRLLVRDDGVGIDPDVLSAGRDGHFGLSGMRERAQRLGAKLSLRSRQGGGTEVELVVPSRIAYPSSGSER